MPLLPLYLRKLGSPVALVGVVIAAFFLAAIFVQYPIGRLSDRIGRRPVQLGGLLTFAVASAVFALIGPPIAGPSCGAFKVPARASSTSRTTPLWARSCLHLSRDAPTARSSVPAPSGSR